MVVVLPPVAADGDVVAPRAVPARPRVDVGRLPRGTCGAGAARCAGTRREVGRAVGLDDHRAGNDVEPLGQAALDAGDLLRVEGQLEHRGRLRGARELGVPDLVAPGAEAGRLVDADQEVGPPAPAVAGERGLVDDVGPGAHRLLGGRARPAANPPSSNVIVDDVAAVAVQLREERRLVLVALPGDEIGELVTAVRAAALAARRLELKSGQIWAGEVGREVGRREPEVAIAELHGPEYRRIGRPLIGRRPLPWVHPALAVTPAGGSWPSTRSRRAGTPCATRPSAERLRLRRLPDHGCEQLAAAQSARDAAQ